MLHRDPRRPLAATLGDRRGDLRIPVSLEGAIGGSQIGRHRVELVDLSCRGCRVRSVLDLAVDSHVVLTISSLAPLGASVRWIHAGELGLRFDRALNPMVVNHIKIARRE